MNRTFISTKKLSRKEVNLLKQEMHLLGKKLKFIEGKVIDKVEFRNKMFNDHSKNEELRNQKNVDDKDIERIAEVVTNFDTVKLGHRSKNNAPSLIYTKMIDGYTYFVIMELWTAKRVLSVKTMYIWLPIEYHDCNRLGRMSVVP